MQDLVFTLQELYYIVYTLYRRKNQFREDPLAQHKSAKKSVRKDADARIRNRSWKSRIKTARKKLETAIEGKKTDEIQNLLREFESVVDKAVSKGVLHKKTASRRKSTMVQRIKRGGEVSPSAAKKTSSGSKAKPAKKTSAAAASKEKEAVSPEENGDEAAPEQDS
jgi:small subunit ribosomal protein S20